MSAAGISVHEANLESNRDSFRGFPWLLRLRYIMENASNIEESKKLWGSTRNTVGFNHMVASASDNSALVMETDAKHTAYFEANSDIEKDSVAHTQY
jgi:predicted choloylglycine hydrolase